MADTLNLNGQVPLRPGFDHATSLDLLSGSFGGWGRLRAEDRAFRSDIGGSYDLWYLLRYADIRAALQDYKLFSSRSVQYLDDSPQRMLPEELDPPEHAKYRRLLNAPLAPNAVRARSDQITRAQTVLHVTGEQDPDFGERAAAAMEIIADVGAAVASRRAEPRDDMISRLVRSTVDDRPLTDDELCQLGFLLYLAGLDTVANVLTYSFRYLTGNPGLRRLLRAEPDHVPEAVEEFLRFFSIASTVRVVTRDAEFAGCPRTAGDRVVLPTASGRPGRRAVPRSG